MKIPSLRIVSLIVVLLALFLIGSATALTDDPPSLTFYDPEGDDTRLQSLGVHEHWNNSTDKQYTRNLDSRDGIEFIYSLPGVEPDYDLITVDFADVVGHGPQYYGSNIFWTEEDINLIKDRMDKSNMNIMRLYIFPYYLENPNDNSDPNSINWDGFNFDTEIPWLEKTVKYSTMFEALKELNMYIMVDIPYLSPWLSANDHVSDDMYSTYPPNNYDEYEELVYAVLYYMVNTIGISPDKIILEPFNEPDLGCGQDPSVHCFWKNHSMDQTANTFLAAYNAAKNVSPNIRVMGMAEWNNGQYVRNFINNYNGLNYLDGITYHKYSNNYDISSLISMGTGFIDDYGLPVFVNEYGSRTWGSDGTNGALWNSYTLTNLLKNSIQPLQFPFFEYPGIGEPYESMGLFYNWNNNWQIKEICSDAA